MSKINRVRILNLNYNNNAIHIDDEIFDLQGESTLLSLRNGGGKSVLVQIIMSLFVHKRYRDTLDRPFSSYFTSSQPTIILVEWALDMGAGYVMTGMLARKNQNQREESNEDELELVQFIHEYKGANDFDLHNIPFVSYKNGKKSMIGFGLCKQELEKAKLDSGYKFDYYDMNQPVRSKAYFDRLQEYQIYYREWETIMKKVNVKESGLSDLFKDAKDEKGLTEKWFLDTIEKKLNREQDRMKEFRTIIQKYMIQYRTKRAKYERKDNINAYFEAMKPLVALEEQLKELEHKKLTAENQIANIIQKITHLIHECNSEVLKKDQLIADIEGSIKQIQYEELSYEIYNKQDYIAGLKNELEDLKEEFTKITSELEGKERELIILESARLYEQYQSDSKDLQRCEMNLSTIKSKEKDLAPERDNLGYTLRLHYEQAWEQNKELLESIQTSIDKAKERKKAANDAITALNQVILKQEKQSGQLEQQIKNYDEVEQRFNQTFDETLKRNILGDYEEALLNTTYQRIKIQQEKNSKQNMNLGSALNQYQQEHSSATSELEERVKQIEKIGNEINVQMQRMERYQSELSSRLEAVRYLDSYDADTLARELEHLQNGEELEHLLSLDDLFDQQKLLSEFQEKMMLSTNQKESIAIQINDLDREYKKLESGRVLEIPEDLEEMLQHEEIQYVTGMKWMKHNHLSVEQNQKLTQENPFLPYSIILSQQEFQRLEKICLQVYTSMPIPVLIREELEVTKREQAGGHLHSYEEVHFYMYFNGNLLDENKLKLMLSEQLEKINQAKELQKRKSEEYDLYQKKYALIAHQEVTTESFKSCRNALKQEKENLKSTKDRESKLRQKLVEVDNAMKLASENINTLKREMENLRQKEQEMESLQKKYEQYLDHRYTFEKLQNSLNDNNKKVNEEKMIITDSDESIDECKDNLTRTQQLQTNLLSKKATYAQYHEGMIINRDLDDVEARYEAITGNISLDLKQAEEEKNRAQERFQKSEEYLYEYTSTNQVKDSDYSYVVYNSYTKQETTRCRNQKSDEKETCTVKINQCDKLISVEESKLETIRENLIKVTGVTEPLTRSMIVMKNFREEMAVKKQEVKLRKEERDKVESKLRILENAGSSFDAYSELNVKEPMEFEESFLEYEASDWKKYNGSMLRNYNDLLEQKNKKNTEIYESCEEVIKQSIFSDDFFQNSLRQLKELRAIPELFLEQYQIVAQSFTQMLEALEVDIAMNEKEKEHILELLLCYVKEVHEHLGKIDNNSRISIRDHYLKMLRIQLPSWEENESIYRVRIQDYLANLAERCIELLEANQNIEELIGSQVSTKYLYDSIVGTSNVAIKLYKIEASREYQITWEQVAKNSGGEGFLSAFVILSSLLSYMRRDDMDIFAEKEEGKVLIMDNPFAQTNASHLLIPLMELAKKSNTQLICLSGLGGESIYNRFDNIYAMSLIPSSLKKGLEYMQTKHVKGEDEFHVVLPSRVKVDNFEQVEMIF